MNFTVTIEGQPSSGNELRITKGYRRTATGVMPFPRIQKSAKAQAYTDGVTILTKAARPSGWRWHGGYLVVSYELFLSHDADGDNIAKTTNDGIAAGLGVNDRYFLTRIACKHVGEKRPRILVTISEAEACAHG